RAHATPASKGGESADRRDLLAERLDVALVQLHGLPQPADPLTVFLRVVLLVGKRRWRAIAVGAARLAEQLLLARELVLEHLAAQLVAAFLRIGVDARKTGWCGRLRGAAARALRARRVVRDVARQLAQVLALRDVRIDDVAVGIDVFADRRPGVRDERQRDHGAEDWREAAASVTERWLTSCHPPQCNQTRRRVQRAGRSSGRPRESRLRRCKSGARPIRGCSTSRTRPDASSSGS